MESVAIVAVPAIEGGKKCPKGMVKDRRKGMHGKCRSKSKISRRSHKNCPHGSIKDRREGKSKTACRKVRVHKTFNSKGKVVKRTYRVVSKSR